VPTKPRKRRLIAAVIVVCVAAAVGVAAYLTVGRVGKILAGSGCTVGKGHGAVPLDPEQAANAATIAGVAHQRIMPSRAVTVAYAAAMQESKLHNISYGDRDSVGIFQQRPSEGWGPASKLKDPVYATTRFFGALEQVPRYKQLPVYKAAQAVQHSADGFAYIQYQPQAFRMAAAFTGHHPHAVWCWSPSGSSGSPKLMAATGALTKAFGGLAGITPATHQDTASMTVTARQESLGWSVATWLVTHAAQYHLREVRFAGYSWRASAGSDGWIKDKNVVTSDAVEAS
jgi:hypothetical protein